MFLECVVLAQPTIIMNRQYLRELLTILIVKKGEKIQICCFFQK